VITVARNSVNRFNGFLFTGSRLWYRPVIQSLMSKHSYSRCWLHVIWTSLDQEPMLTKPAVAKASRFLSNYSLEKGIYMKISYVNPEHVHTLIDLPTNKTIEEVVQLFKGGSSHWIN
jgi:putative transposase